jgi:hypothetical protein
MHPLSRSASDHAIGHREHVVAHLALERLGEWRQRRLDEGWRCLDHHGAMPLATISVWDESVSLAAPNNRCAHSFDTVCRTSAAGSAARHASSCARTSTATSTSPAVAPTCRRSTDRSLSINMLSSETHSELWAATLAAA